VGHAVGFEGVKTLEIQKRRGEVIAGGIPLIGGEDIAAGAFDNGGILRKRLIQHLAQHQRRGDIAAEFVGEVKTEGCRHGLVVENGGVEKTRQHRLLFYQFAGFNQYSVPECHKA